MEKPKIGSKWLVIDPDSENFEKVLTVTKVEACGDQRVLAGDATTDFRIFGDGEATDIVWFDGVVCPDGPFVFWPDEVCWWGGSSENALAAGALVMPAPENNG